MNLAQQALLHLLNIFLQVFLTQLQTRKLLIFFLFELL